MHDRQPIREAIQGCDLKAEILKPDPNQEGHLKDYRIGRCGQDSTAGHFCMAEFYDNHPEYSRYSRSGM
jgi:hypothetical protein